MKLHRLFAVMRKESREILRDRVTLSTAFLFPVMMLFMFGYAISLEVEGVKLGVLDQDQTPSSAALIDAFAESRYFMLVRRYESEFQIRDSMERSEVKLALVIPPGFNALVGRENLPEVPDLADPAVQERYPDIPEYLGKNPPNMGLGIKREAPSHY